MTKRSERLDEYFPPERAWLPLLTALLTALLLVISVGYLVLLVQTNMALGPLNLEAIRGLSMAYLATALLLCLLISVLTLAACLLTGDYARTRSRTQRHWWFSLALVFAVMLLTEMLTHLRLH